MRYAKVPHPGEVLWTIDALSILFHQRPRSLYQRLWDHASRFGPLLYDHGGQGRRRRRLLTAQDVNTLRQILKLDAPVVYLPKGRRRRIA